jgi:catechol 2,3-dioxygenase-like lactoylglutathione lyase family enzyme
VLGDFLEISLSTRDILASIEFYRKLGFSEAPAGSTWKHPYTVMTDGRLYLGLHKRDAASPALSFVLPELSRRLPDFETLGIELTSCNIGLDQFNELSFLDPDGQLVTLLEARTYSPVHAAHLPATLCGYFQEFRLSVRNRAASVRFWEAMGFIVSDENESSGSYAQASWGGINLGLNQTARTLPPELVFSRPGLDEVIPFIEMRGLDMKEDAQGVRLATPEGLNLVLRPEEP